MEAKHNSSKRYPPEVKDRAVRMVLEARREDPADHTVISRIARQLGIGAESLRSWVKQAQVDEGQRPGVSAEEKRRIAELEKEVKELRRANEMAESTC